MLKQRWASQNVLQSEGQTRVSSDLWSKNSQVKYLERLSIIFIANTSKKFKNPEKYYEFLTEAVRHYTIDFGFNKVMMLLKYIGHDDINQNLMSSKAAKQWNLLEPKLFGNTRVMAHLTSNCIVEKDIVVYRGFKDKRRKAVKNTLSLEKKNLENIRILLEKEQQLKNMLKNPHDIAFFISKGSVSEIDMIDPDNIGVANDWAEDLKNDNTDLNMESRDIDELVNGIGNMIETETFMSTSLVIEQARRFMDREDGCCLLEITVPAGTPAFYVSPFSDFRGENNEFELVLPPCAKLIVTGKSKGVTRVRYDGISEIAKKRMTLDAQRIFFIQELLQTLTDAEEAKHVLKNGVGLIKLCKTFNGSREYSPIEDGELLTTFSNDTLQE